MLLVRWQERYLLQWHVPNGMLPCRWYIAREHDHWQSCKLSGYWCLPTVHQHQSPSARWYEGALEASSSLLMVRIMHWQPRDDLACKKMMCHLFPKFLLAAGGCRRPRGNWLTQV